jgi:hypothetical protein
VKSVRLASGGPGLVCFIADAHQAAKPRRKADSWGKAGVRARRGPRLLKAAFGYRTESLARSF